MPKHEEEFKLCEIGNGIAIFIPRKIRLQYGIEDTDSIILNIAKMKVKKNKNVQTPDSKNNEQNSPRRSLLHQSPTHEFLDTDNAEQRLGKKSSN